jgi:hypothetical protein
VPPFKDVARETGGCGVAEVSRLEGLIALKHEPKSENKKLIA